MQIKNPPLRTIRLYGKMGSRFGRVHHFVLDTNTPAEAVQALMSQIMGFREYLMHAKDNGFGFSVFAGKQNLAEDHLNHPVGNDDIRIAPMILGSKNGGVFGIILGAVLVTAAIIATGGVAAAFAGGIWSAVATSGVAMVVGGVAQLLTPMPKGLSSKDKPANTPNYSFNGPINTQAQGNPVPLLYGRLKVGSAVISAGIDVDDTVYTPASPGAGSGTMGGGGGSGLTAALRTVMR